MFVNIMLIILYYDNQEQDLLKISQILFFVSACLIDSSRQATSVAEWRQSKQTAVASSHEEIVCC